MHSVVKYFYKQCLDRPAQINVIYCIDSQLLRIS